MKKIFLIVLLFGFTKAFGQSINDYEYDKVRIVDTSQEVEADIIPVNAAPKAKNDRLYYWYKANSIHATQGGFSGKLLNGHYTAYYPDKSLKEEGDFKKGLKNGVWKTWDRIGGLTNTVNWDEGMVAVAKPSIWNKIPFLRKKTDSSSVAKPRKQ